MKLEQAHKIALEIVAALSPACDRIIIAGSIRRAKPDPKDIEIVYIPRMENGQTDLFSTGPVPATEALISDLVRQNFWHFDPIIRRNGPKYKRLIRPHIGGDATVELFRADPDNWGYILALRTGPSGFNKILVAKPWHAGACPLNVTLRDGYVHRDGKRIPIREEADFFNIMNIPHWPPASRSAGLLATYLQHREENNG